MAKRKQYNPEKRAWKGKSYKAGKRISKIKEDSLRKSDKKGA